VTRFTRATAVSVSVSVSGLTRGLRRLLSRVRLLW
jgi:hypothetical protein